VSGSPLTAAAPARERVKEPGLGSISMCVMCSTSRAGGKPGRRAARPAGIRDLVLPRVADLVADPRHAGSLDGAFVGEAGEERMLVRVGLWIAERRVLRARYRATTCAALIAYCEAACAALERGLAPGTFDDAALRRSVAGVHPVHHDRAALVVRAVHAAHRRAEESRR
jgi:hypothetical protein